MHDRRRDEDISRLESSCRTHGAARHSSCELPSPLRRRSQNANSWSCFYKSTPIEIIRLKRSSKLLGVSSVNIHLQLCHMRTRKHCSSGNSCCPTHTSLGIIRNRVSIKFVGPFLHNVLSAGSRKILQVSAVFTSALLLNSSSSKIRHIRSDVSRQRYIEYRFLRNWEHWESRGKRGKCACRCW